MLVHKKRFFFFALMLIGGLAACAAPPAGPLPPASGSAPTAPATLAPQVEAAVPEQPSPTPLPANLLDAATTFEVIAAVHANLEQIASWLPQGLSAFERRAVVQPIAEIRILPLEAVFNTFLPQAGLAESWQQSAEIAREFIPLLFAWLDGALPEDEFSQQLAGWQRRSGSLLQVAEDAASQLGVEADSLGPDYALAPDVVFRLVPGSQAAGPGAAGSTQAARKESPSLEVRQLNPFTYPFAGMDVFLAIGMLENTGAQAQQQVEIEIRFYNFLGEHLGTLSGKLLSPFAFPGEQSPFSASIVTEGEETALQDWVDYQVTVYSRPVPEAPGPPPVFDLAVSSVSPSRGGGWRVLGTLANPGSESYSLSDLRLGLMVFDADGNLVGVAGATVNSTGSLLPGQTVPIEAVLEALSGEPAEYRFFAQVSNQ